MLEGSGFSGDCGIFSIDIDGVDYHVLAELKDWTPSILIVEYNALFGKARAVSVPYDPEFNAPASIIRIFITVPAFRLFFICWVRAGTRSWAPTARVTTRSSCAGSFSINGCGKSR